MYILEYMVGYRQIQQHYIQQHKGKSLKYIILHATGTQQPLGAALGRHVTLKYEAATYLCVYNLCVGSSLWVRSSLVCSFAIGVGIQDGAGVFFLS